jgi:hypothetical protein
VALHDGIVKKYNGDGEEVLSLAVDMIDTEKRRSVRKFVGWWSLCARELLIAAH